MLKTKDQLKNKTFLVTVLSFISFVAVTNLFGVNSMTTTIFLLIVSIVLLISSVDFFAGSMQEPAGWLLLKSLHGDVPGHWRQPWDRLGILPSAQGPG